MAKTAKNKLKPIEARTFRQICTLPRDNIDAKGFWILVDVGRVTIAQQKSGEVAKATIHIPRAQFDRMVRWYLTGRAANKATDRGADR